MKKEDFKEFIKYNIDDAYRFTFSYVNNKENAEDVLSEAVVKGLEGIGQLRNPEYMKTWFYRIIINTANTMFKKKSKISYIESDNQDYYDYILPEHFDDYSYLSFYEILDSLSPERRIVLILYYYEGNTLKEIGEILDLNESTVKKRLYSSLDILKGIEGVI